MWIEAQGNKSYNMDRYKRIACSGRTVYLIDIEDEPGDILWNILFEAQEGKIEEIAKGVYEWIMQCLEKERPVCRISDAPVLRSMPEGSVTEWRMK